MKEIDPELIGGSDAAPLKVLTQTTELLHVTFLHNNRFFYAVWVDLDEDDLDVWAMVETSQGLVDAMLGNTVTVRSLFENKQIFAIKTSRLEESCIRLFEVDEIDATWLPLAEK